MTESQVRGMVRKFGFRILRGDPPTLKRVEGNQELPDEVLFKLKKWRHLFMPKPKPAPLTTEEKELCQKHKEWLESHFGRVKLLALQRENGEVWKDSSTG